MKYVILWSLSSNWNGDTSLCWSNSTNYSMIPTPVKWKQSEKSLFQFLDLEHLYNRNNQNYSLNLFFVFLTSARELLHININFTVKIKCYEVVMTMVKCLVQFGIYWVLDHKLLIYGPVRAVLDKPQTGPDIYPT